MMTAQARNDLGFAACHCAKMPRNAESMRPAMAGQSQEKAAEIAE